MEGTDGTMLGPFQTDRFNSTRVGNIFDSFLVLLDGATVAVAFANKQSVRMGSDFACSSASGLSNAETPLTQRVSCRRLT